MLVNKRPLCMSLNTELNKKIKKNYVDHAPGGGGGLLAV